MPNNYTFWTNAKDSLKPDKSIIMAFSNYRHKSGKDPKRLEDVPSPTPLQHSRASAEILESSEATSKRVSSKVSSFVEGVDRVTRRFPKCPIFLICSRNSLAQFEMPNFSKKYPKQSSSIRKSKTSTLNHLIPEKTFLEDTHLGKNIINLFKKK
jgi:hypothetical protein